MIQEYFGIELSDSVHLALPLMNTETVAKFEQKSICVIPGIAPFWYGVFNYKGLLLWVLDIDQFFDLSSQDDSPEKKLTAVVLSHQHQGTRRRVALVVQQLKGILSFEQNRLESFSSLSSSLSPSLSNSCTAKIEQDNKVFYVLDSDAFLERLYQSSELLVAF